MIIFNLIRGMFMAFADSVPGVSGGTIAFVMGFYNQFIDSITTLTSHSSKEEKKDALIFLLKIGVGWAIGMVISILLISSVLDTHIYDISSLFLGFIAFSIPLIYKEEKDVIKGNNKHFIYLLIGFAIVALITYFNPISRANMDQMSKNKTQTTITHDITSQDTTQLETSSVSSNEIPTGITTTTNSSFSIGMGIYVFFAGMIAISAMVLPGISGSTLLLIFGLYSTIITNIKDFINYFILLAQHLIGKWLGKSDFPIMPEFNLGGFLLLIVFGIGVLVGLASVVRVISKLLKTKRSQLIYFIFGLMIASLYAVVMGPTTLDTPQIPMTFETFNIIFFIIGALIILGLEKLKTIMQA